MDLRGYYGRIRKIEDGISEEVAVVISRATPDGGRAGVKADVPRSVAARMIADGKADLAGPEDAAKFRAEAEGKWKDATYRRKS